MKMFITRFHKRELNKSSWKSAVEYDNMFKTTIRKRIMKMFITRFHKQDLEIHR